MKQCKHCNLTLVKVNLPTQSSGLNPDFATLTWVKPEQKWVKLRGYLALYFTKHHRFSMKPEVYFTTMIMLVKSLVTFKVLLTSVKECLNQLQFTCYGFKTL